MTNFEKYKDQIIEEIDKKQSGCCLLALKARTKKDEGAICLNNDCKDCTKELLEWLAKEYTESKKEFTQDELAILRNIDKTFEWIARDKNNILIIFLKKPFKASDYWTSNDLYQTAMRLNCFKQIQWEDSEPVFIDDYVERK